MRRAILLAALLSTGAAHADPGSRWAWGPGSALELDPPLEIGLLGLGLPLWLVPHFYDPALAPPACGQPGHLCDLSTVPSFDRALMFYNPSLRPPADLLFTYAPFVVLAGLFFDYGPANWRGWLTDVTIIVEAWAWAGALTHVFRYAVRRPRPYLYFDDQYPDQHYGADATMSFPAGHVSELVGWAVATGYVMTLRRGRSWRAVVTWSAMVAACVAINLFRVGSGDHFASDALVGTLIGTGTGLLVPWMHKRRAPSLAVVPYYSEGAGGIGIGGRF